MPRKNNRLPHRPYQPPQNDAKKRRFASRQAAQAAANQAMLLSPHLTLSVYRGLDGGWYLTSQATPH